VKVFIVYVDGIEAIYHEGLESIAGAIRATGGSR
jgi:hypothetical protein